MTSASFWDSVWMLMKESRKPNCQEYIFVVCAPPAPWPFGYSPASLPFVYSFPVPLPSGHSLPAFLPADHSPPAPSSAAWLPLVLSTFESCSALPSSPRLLHGARLYPHGSHNPWLDKGELMDSHLVLMKFKICRKVSLRL